MAAFPVWKFCVMLLITWPQSAHLTDYDYDYDSENCGQPDAPPGQGLRNGGYAEPRSAPWQAQLCLTNPWQRGTNHCFCGGVLISNSVVLTAAHCFNTITRYTMRYRLFIKLGGETYYPFRSNGMVGVTTHYSFERRIFDHDIALITLGREVTYSSTIKPVCLPDHNTPSRIGTALVTGWDRQPRLREIKMNVIEWQTCVTTPRHRDRIITTNMLCAKDVSHHADIIKGFSGGPLVVMQNGRWVLHGIVSWGFPHRPITVFTEVAKYTSWLQDEAGVGW